MEVARAKEALHLLGAGGEAREGCLVGANVVGAAVIVLLRGTNSEDKSAAQGLLWSLMGLSDWHIS